MLCRFCRYDEDGPPNEAVGDIVVGYNRTLPACGDCITEYSEITYNDWLADQPDDDRDMRDSNLDAVREMGL